MPNSLLNQGTVADLRTYAAVDFKCGKRGWWSGPQVELVWLARVSPRQLRRSLSMLQRGKWVESRRNDPSVSHELSYFIPSRFSPLSSGYATTGQFWPTVRPTVAAPFSILEQLPPPTPPLPPDASRPVSLPEKTVVTEDFLATMREKYALLLRDFDASVKKCMGGASYRFHPDKQWRLEEWLKQDVEDEQRRSGHAAVVFGSNGTEPRDEFGPLEHSGWEPEYFGRTCARCGVRDGHGPPAHRELAALYAEVDASADSRGLSR